MSLESGSVISHLVVTNPLPGDPKSVGPAHMRLIKNTYKNTFPYLDSAISASVAELNMFARGGTVSGSLTIKGDISASHTTELNLLTGSTTGGLYLKSNALGFAGGTISKKLFTKIWSTTSGTITLGGNGSGIHNSSVVQDLNSFYFDTSIGTTWLKTSANFAVTEAGLYQFDYSHYVSVSASNYLKLTVYIIKDSETAIADRFYYKTGVTSETIHGGGAFYISGTTNLLIRYTANYSGSTAKLKADGTSKETWYCLRKL